MMNNSLSSLFACFHAKYLVPYGAGTLMWVFTMVTEAFSPNALPSSVVIPNSPAVEIVTPALAMMVPTMLQRFSMRAALPTHQKTFLALAPLVRLMLRGNPGAPMVSEAGAWKTQTAFGSP
jgi:hypothetical protein